VRGTVAGLPSSGTATRDDRVPATGINSTAPNAIFISPGFGVLSRGIIVTPCGVCARLSACLLRNRDAALEASPSPLALCLLRLACHMFLPEESGRAGSHIGPPLSC